MAEPISDEEFAENLRLRCEFLNLDPSCPGWLWEATHFAVFGQQEIERAWGKQLTDRVQAEFEVYLWTLMDIEEAFSEGMGSKGEKIAQLHQMIARDALLDAIGKQYANIDAWKKKFDAGYRRKIGGKDFRWLAMLDDNPEWMERIPRGKGMGWKLSDKHIERILVTKLGDDAPDAATINRERNRRLK